MKATFDFVVFASIFVFISAATAIPSEIGEAAGQGSTAASSDLDNLSGQEKKFYELIVAPLVAKCSDKHSDWALSTLAKIEIEILCKNAYKLMRLFKEFASQNKMVKMTNFVYADLDALQWIYFDLLSREVASPIMSEVVALLKVPSDIDIKGQRRKQLDKAFRETFWQMKKLAEEGEERDTFDTRKAAYKLLNIGAYMVKYAFDRTDEEYQKWAMQQFAATLAVYSLRVDPLKFYHVADIQKISERWPIGMLDN